MTSASSDTVVLSYHDSLLRKSDVGLLDGSNWLNDQIIGFAFEYFTQEQFSKFEDQVCFINPSLTQLIKLIYESGDDLGCVLDPLNLTSKNYIFLPVNDHGSSTSTGGAHWSLLFYDRKQSTFFHADSSGDHNSAAAQSTVKQIGKHLQRDSKPHYKLYDRCPQQTNSCDCGVYVISITEHICRQIFENVQQPLNEAVTPESIKQKRVDLKSLIYKLAKLSSIGK